MYSTQVVLLDLAGGVTLPLTGKLWELSTVINGAGNVRDIANDNETATVQAGVISFQDGPSYLDRNNHTIGLTIQAAGDEGPLFRSGRYDSLPPGAPGDPKGLVEIMVPAPVSIPVATITASLPALPLALADCITITALTLTLSTGMVTLVAAGTKCIPIFPPVGFTYTLSFDIQPTFGLEDPTLLFDIVPSGPGVLGPPAVAAIAGLFGTTESEIRRTVIQSLARVLSSSTLTTAAASAGVPSLPPSLIVSIRRTTITAGGISIAPALGAFGGIASTFLQDLVDGTLLREVTAPQIYVVYGGAKFYIPSPQVFDALGFDWNAVRLIPNGVMAQVPDLPRDGTVLREMSSAPVYVMQGGQRHWILDPATLEQRFGGWAAVRIVPDGGLANIPEGAQIAGEPAQCAQIRAQIQQKRQEIHDLQDSKAGLNPRDPADRWEIKQINASIGRARVDISNLESQGTTLGCTL